MFEAMWRGSTWIGAEATMARAATMCAREAQHAVAINLLRQANLETAAEASASEDGGSGAGCGSSADGGSATGGSWQERIGGWIVSQELTPPWPATFATLSLGVEAVRAHNNSHPSLAPLHRTSCSQHPPEG